MEKNGRNEFSVFEILLLFDNGQSDENFCKNILRRKIIAFKLFVEFRNFQK